MKQSERRDLEENIDTASAAKGRKSCDRENGQNALYDILDDRDPVRERFGNDILFFPLHRNLLQKNLSEKSDLIEQGKRGPGDNYHERNELRVEPKTFEIFDGLPRFLLYLFFHRDNLPIKFFECTSKLLQYYAFNIIVVKNKSGIKKSCLRKIL